MTTVRLSALEGVLRLGAATFPVIGRMDCKLLVAMVVCCRVECHGDDNPPRFFPILVDPAVSRSVAWRIGAAIGEQPKGIDDDDEC